MSPPNCRFASYPDSHRLTPAANDYYPPTTSTPAPSFSPHPDVSPQPQPTTHPTSTTNPTPTYSIGLSLTASPESVPSLIVTRTSTAKAKPRPQHSFPPPSTRAPSATRIHCSDDRDLIIILADCQQLYFMFPSLDPSPTSAVFRADPFVLLWPRCLFSAAC